MLWTGKKEGVAAVAEGRFVAMVAVNIFAQSLSDCSNPQALTSFCTAAFVMLILCPGNACRAGRNSWVAIKGLLAQPRRASSSMISGQSAKVTLHVADDSRCFSILTESQSLHVEMPKGGNGRSRREWMDAIASLDACGTSAIALSVYG